MVSYAFKPEKNCFALSIEPISKLIFSFDFLLISPIFNADHIILKLAQLARIPDVQLISSQKFHGVDQLEQVPADIGIIKWESELDQGDDAFIDTAAIMKIWIWSSPSTVL